MKPIGRDEYLARIANARALMGKHGIGALLIEPGASMAYFTGVQWRRSERLTAAILPREGEASIVTPHFEEPSVRESLAGSGGSSRLNEDDDLSSPSRGVLRSVAAPVAVEDTVRFFVVDVAARCRAWPFVNGAPVVRGCRMIKSPAELALMQLASDITIAAYRHTAPRTAAA